MTLLTSDTHAGIDKYSCSFDTANNAWVVLLPASLAALDFLVENERAVLLTARAFNFTLEAVLALVFAVIVRVARCAVRAGKFGTFVTVALFKVL